MAWSGFVIMPYSAGQFVSTGRVKSNIGANGPRPSGPMIGVPSQDHSGTIELFGQHRAKQHMRPGGAAEGDPLLRPVKNRAVMSVSAANGEIGRRDTIVTISPQEISQCL